MAENGDGDGDFGRSGHGGMASASKRVVTTKLFVGNLPETCKRGDLLAAFKKFGNVTECDIVKNYAFVHYENSEDATVSVAALDDTEFQGVKIKVELSHSRVRQKPGMGGNECYRCGKEGHWSKDCPKYASRGRGRGSSIPTTAGSRSTELYTRERYLRDPYAADYYRDRYPAPAHERYRPYADPYERRALPPPPPRDPYYSERLDPYTRPPPDYYSRRSPPPPPPPRDPYYDAYYERASRYPPPSAAVTRI